MVLDLFFTIAFTIEIAIKSMSHNFMFGPGAYLKSGWNWIDFLSTASGYLHYLPIGDSGGLSGIRAMRALRPLRALNAVPGGVGAGAGAAEQRLLLTPTNPRLPHVMDKPGSHTFQQLSPVQTQGKYRPCLGPCRPPPGLRILVETLLEAVPLLIDVILLLTWIFFVFGGWRTGLHT